MRWMGAFRSIVALIVMVLLVGLVGARAAPITAPTTANTTAAADIGPPASPLSAPILALSVIPNNPQRGANVTITVSLSGNKSSPGTPALASVTAEYEDSGQTVRLDPVSCTVQVGAVAGSPLQNIRIPVTYPIGWTLVTNPTFTDLENPTTQMTPAAGMALFTATRIAADHIGSVTWTMRVP